jgi:hypothetical protein
MIFNYVAKGLKGATGMVWRQVAIGRFCTLDLAAFLGVEMEMSVIYVVAIQIVTLALVSLLTPVFYYN